MALNLDRAAFHQSPLPPKQPLVLEHHVTPVAPAAVDWTVQPQNRENGIREGAESVTWLSRSSAVSKHVSQHFFHHSRSPRHPESQILANVVGDLDKQKNDSELVPASGAQSRLGSSGAEKDVLAALDVSLGPNEPSPPRGPHTLGAGFSRPVLYSSSRKYSGYYDHLYSHRPRLEILSRRLSHISPKKHDDQ